MSLYNQLFDYQKNIVDNFKDKKSFGLFLDMGLGKTILSLALAEKNNCNKVIVITINSKAIEDESVKGSWLWWAKSSDINYSFCNKHNKSFSFLTNNNDLLIINYESLFVRKKDELKKHSDVKLNPIFKEFIKSCKDKNVALILDESHKVKNLESKTTKSVLSLKRQLLLRSKSLYIYLLTGTPFTQGYIDLYAQLKILGYPDTKGNFKERFCEMGNVPGLLGWQQPIVGYKNIEELFDMVHHYAITIETNSVLKLPEQIFKVIPQKTSHSFKMYTYEKAYPSDILYENSLHTLKLPDISKYENVTKKVNNPYYANIDFPKTEWLGLTSGVFHLRARQLSIGFNGNSENYIWYDKSRLNSLEEFLENNIDNYIIFYNFTPELFEIYSICEKLGYNIDIYCGEIKSEHFYEQYEKNPTLNNRKNILIANFASGSTGKNWQAYNKVIIFSLPTYDDYAQGIKRVHRPGQTKPVFYYIFQSNNWLDTSMKEALDNKQNYSNDMFESDLHRVNYLMKDD